MEMKREEALLREAYASLHLACNCLEEYLEGTVDVDKLCGDWKSQSGGDDLRIHKEAQSYKLTVFQKTWILKHIRPKTYDLSVDPIDGVLVRIGHFDELLEYDFRTDTVRLSYLGNFSRIKQRTNH